MAANQRILSHGKYAGSSFEQVLRSDREYVAWVVRPSHVLPFSLRMFAFYSQFRVP